jgi:hypothetical protein
MELSLLVNAANEEGDPNAWPEALRGSAPPVGPQPAVQTPCLYLGPVGQRCNQPARASGFCSRHQLNPSDSGEVSNATIVKRAVAVIGVIVALWPLLADLVRELIRLLR